MGRHATPVATDTSKPPFFVSAMDLREHLLLSCVFYFALLSAFFKHSLVLFHFKTSRGLCWSPKHSPGPTICLNHSKLQKRNIGSFYLRKNAGQSRNIKLYKELVLRSVKFKVPASYWVWTLFMIDEYVKSHKFYPFGHRPLQTVIK